jgi:hypothetical protein
VNSDIVSIRLDPPDFIELDEDQALSYLQNQRPWTLAGVDGIPAHDDDSTGSRLDSLATDCSRHRISERKTSFAAGGREAGDYQAKR